VIVNTYNITASTTSADGAISPVGSTAVSVGGTQTYSIAPAAGYKINYVAVNGASVGAVSSYTLSKVGQNYTIKADFVPITRSRCHRAERDCESGTYSGFTAGASQTYKIIPNTGYQIATLTVDGVSQPVATNYSFTNIQANHTITATFVAGP
jgi:hypothetical protein